MSCGFEVWQRRRRPGTFSRSSNGWLVADPAGPALIQVVAQIVINGPASLPYDIDLGAFPISDYYLAGADDIVLATKNGGPPLSDNVLFNGTNINWANPSQGKYANVTLTPGKRHRLRLINPSVENHFSVTLQNHSMTIIASDLVPVNAQTVDSVFLGVGQRLDVTIDASQTVTADSNFWLNVTYSSTGLCGGSKNPHPAAVFHYAGALGALPAQPGALPADAETGCMDLPNLTPVVTRSAPAQAFAPHFNASNTLPVQLDTTGPAEGLPLFQWKVNGSGINVDWNNPVTKYLVGGQTVPAGNNPVVVPGASDTDVSSARPAVAVTLRWQSSGLVGDVTADVGGLNSGRSGWSRTT
jgi:hypothetical protein